MSANLRAFLAVIRRGEGTSDEDGYRRIVGGDLFSGWADHPRVLKSGTFANGVAWRSTAAGAYQFLSSTWDAARAALGLPDFSPKSQDEAALWLIKRRGALDLIEVGRIPEAVQLCATEWASLPGSPYGQPTITLAECLRVYKAAGGFLSDAEQQEQQPAGATPSVPPVSSSSPPAGHPPMPAPAAPAPTEPTMPAIAPLVIAAGQMLYPIVADLFKAHGSKTATRNAGIIEQAAPALVEIAKQVTGQPTAEQAVAKVQADVSMREQFRSAVADDLDRILGAIARMVEIDDASADRAAARTKSDDSVNAATPILIYGALIGVGTVFFALLVLMGLQVWMTPDHKPMEALVVLFVSVVGQIIGFAAAIYMYRFGSSAGSKASGDAVRAIAEQARKG